MSKITFNKLLLMSKLLKLTNCAISKHAITSIHIHQHLFSQKYKVIIRTNEEMDSFWFCGTGNRDFFVYEFTNLERDEAEEIYNNAINEINE